MSIEEDSTNSLQILKNPFTFTSKRRTIKFHRITKVTSSTKKLMDNAIFTYGTLNVSVASLRVGWNSNEASQIISVVSFRNIYKILGR